MILKTDNNIDLINSALEKYLPVRHPAVIWEAMRYSALAGGKRLRSRLVLESTRVCGGDIMDALPTACAVEMLHCQSLIHDDLPCMDNDDFRRGQPTNHRVFGEATAVLAGDALVTLAPQVIMRHTPPHIDRGALLQVLDEFFTAAGAMGIVGGQVVDICSEGREIDIDTFNYILEYKTGALFRFSTRAGALLAGACPEKIDTLTVYGEKIGYAFQIYDDILDVTGTLDQLGKTPGKDGKSGKNTYITFYGFEKAVNDLNSICGSAQKLLTDNGIGSDLLMEIADSIKWQTRD